MGTYDILLSTLKWILLRVTILGMWLTDLLTERLLFLNGSLKLSVFPDRSVDKFNAPLVAKRFSKNQGQDYDKTFALLVRFDCLHLLLSIGAVNSFVPL
jgi:hypothetical protein